MYDIYIYIYINILQKYIFYIEIYMYVYKHCILALFGMSEKYTSNAKILLKLCTDWLQIKVARNYTQLWSYIKKTVKCKELESYEMLIGSFLMYKDKIIITGKVKIEYI